MLASTKNDNEDCQEARPIYLPIYSFQEGGYTAAPPDRYNIHYHC